MGLLEQRRGSIRRAVLKILFRDAHLSFMLCARIAFAVELSTIWLRVGSSLFCAERPMLWRLKSSRRASGFKATGISKRGNISIF